MRQRTRKQTGFLRRIERFHVTDRTRALFAVLAIAYLLSYVVVVIHTQYTTLFRRIRLADYEIGSIAQNDLILDRDIQFTDEKATALKREAQANLVPPVFVEHEEISSRILDRFEAFAGVYAQKRAEGVSAEKLFFELQSALPGVFDQSEFGPIASYRDPAYLVETSRNVLVSLVNRGLVRFPDSAKNGAAGSETVELWHWDKGQQWKEQLPASTLVELSALHAAIGAVLENAEPDQLAAVGSVVSRFVEENVFYDENQTEKNRQTARLEVAPVQKRLLKGERIIRSGFIITPEDYREVEALSKYSVTVNLNALFGNALFLALLLCLAVVFVSPPFQNRRIEKQQAYFLAGIAVSYLAISTGLIRSIPFPDWMPVSALLPTALLAMLGYAFVGFQTSIGFTLIFSLSILPIAKMDALAAAFAFFSGVSGILVMRDTERRIDLIRAGAVLGALNVLALLTIGLFRNYTFGQFLRAGLWGVLNGMVCGGLNLVFLPILEHLVNAPTRFRLMELSDLNAPILKRMLTLAPGTYNHSVIVANLAESACREIGANALLARVGAYYHDIGKIDQAEYFIENQTSYNKHDDLKPSLSVAVIKSHVKIGVEKAKELRLPKEVIEIISQHHGSGLISFFYQRAVDEEGNGHVSPDDFSYTGSPPVSKEAAVVMLADSAEAAARTLKHPTVAKLEKFVWSIILDKFHSEQLNECDLTFKDLETIKRTFVQILAGNFHSRIEYPKVKEGQR
jgi:putative nucleotidyltransferase with HDIG domain